MRTIFGIAISLLIALQLLWPTLQTNSAGQVLAFPGAEGYGAKTVGGRGGRVIEVTNLNDSGPGSLRACAQASGPRYCLFRVAGYINLKTPIQVREPYLTIAGQTAPGDGITLRNVPGNLGSPLEIMTHEVIVRYLRSRPGPSSTNVDAILIANNKPGNVYNIIIDHTSLSWAVDENLNVWYDARDITVQWSIVSEGLDCSIHADEPDQGEEEPKGCHSKGPLFGSEGATNISFHHNLLAHNVDRNPQVNLNGLADVVNNVIYIPGTLGASIRDQYGKASINFVGNRIIAPWGDGLVYGLQAYPFGTDYGFSIYAKGNLGPYRTADNQPEQLAVAPNSRSYMTSGRHEAPEVTTSSATAAYAQVLAEAGANKGLDSLGQFYQRRDSVDERIIQDTINQTGDKIDDPSEVGGWPQLEAGVPYLDSDHDGMPDNWERKYGLNPNKADHNQDIDKDGYTNLEEFLNGTHPGSPSPTSTPTSTKPAPAGSIRVYLPVIVNTAFLSWF